MAFRTWEYKQEQKRLGLKQERKNKAPVIRVTKRQKRREAYLRDLFLDKDTDTRLTREEVARLLAGHKKGLEQKDVVSLLTRRARAIRCSR